MIKPENVKYDHLTPEQLAAVIIGFRELRTWTQETLAELAHVSVRTIQRIEKGQPSDLDTRRSLARAFDLEDIDIFNKPLPLPDIEAIQKEQRELERNMVKLDLHSVASARELVNAFESSNAMQAHCAVTLSEEADYAFAQFVDYLRDYGDLACDLSEMERREIYRELQSQYDVFVSPDIVVCYAFREAKYRLPNDAVTTPWPVNIIYVCVFQKDSTPLHIAVPKSISFA